MTNLTENSVWESGIYQLETDDPTLGGPPGFNLGEPVTGHANAQAQQLANRTKYLKDRVEEAPSQINSAISTHDGDALAHPGLVSNLSSQIASLSSDLANTTDPLKGASLVGFLPQGVGALPSDVQTALRAAVKGSSSQKVKIIAGVLRNYGIAGSPSWQWIVDANHNTLNMGSISILGKALRIDFNDTFSKCISLVACPDDTYAAQGFTIGASVGTQNAIIYMGHHMQGYVNMSSGIVTLNSPSLWPSADCQGVISGSGVITITHLDNGGAQQTAWPKQPTSPYRLPRFATQKISNTSFSIHPYNELGGYARFDGISWGVLTSTVSGISISETGGTVTVTHPDVGSTTPPIISNRDNGTVIAMLDSFTGTSFTVKFRDFSGAPVTTNSTDMRFTFSRSGMLPAGIAQVGEAYFDVGYVSVDMSYPAVTGANIWVIGVFEDAEDASP